MTFKDYLIYNRYKFKNFHKYITFKTKTIEEIKSLNRNLTYQYFLDYFNFYSNGQIRKHRNYFKLNKRGFGEDAFHGMWDCLFKTYKPKNILEIGVYRGQTLSLFQLLSRLYRFQSNIWGISPLNDEGDEESDYLKINYKEDVNNNFDFFNLEKPNILEEYSTSEKSIDFIKSSNWDLIYIDGNHNYEVVSNDAKNAINSLSENGILVIDDSSLYTDFEYTNKNINTFKGHPGPSKVFETMMRDKKLTFLFGVGHNNIFINKNL
tara:strand:+ start:174 stop:965 length:792 start_codon:yes stop_codon:yes gene_type:complete